MYFLLGNLAFLDIFFTSSTTPKLFAILVSDSRAIAKTDCILQFYIYFSLGATEFCILALMSFDRYVAISFPLRYCTIMTYQFCWSLITSSWIFGFLEFIPSVYLVSQFNWCHIPNYINHFFCDGSMLLYSSCSDTHVAEIMVFGFASFTILASFITNLTSYCFILTSIFTISSSEGRNKTFSTCSSHLLVLVFTYGSSIFIYVRKAGSLPTNLEKSFAIFNSILGPSLNPFIYTLRNKIVKRTIKNICRVKDH
uniref:Olfactory receptor n=1 Tax=Leptobrachium leishanense TaxID=445787 RepID=A0A8C5M6F2_9ANUR